MTTTPNSAVPILSQDMASAWCNDDDDCYPPPNMKGPFCDAMEALALGQTVVITAERLAQVETLERDAARYQWLRHGDNDEMVMRAYSVFTTGKPSHFLERNESLDYLIDAAIKEQT